LDLIPGGKVGIPFFIEVFEGTVAGFKPFPESLEGVSGEAIVHRIGEETYGRFVPEVVKEWMIRCI